MRERTRTNSGLPPNARAEILKTLCANMEISSDEIVAILKRHHVAEDIVPHCHLLFFIQSGIALVEIQRLFTGGGDPPQQAVYLASFPGCDGCHAVSPGVSPEQQLIILQNDRTHHMGIRTAVRHLLQVDIAAV